MTIRKFIKINFLSLLVLTILFAEGEQKFAGLGEFILENGKTIENCKIGYRTIGQINQDSSNIIIYPTWFGGTSAQIKSLIVNNNFISTDKYCIIAIDALGNGISSSPSNSRNRDLPLFTIRDMVRTQYRLLTEELGFDHIFAIVGGSMGSFQSFEWLVSYPDFMEKSIPYVCTPKLSFPDKLWMQLQLEIINSVLEQGCSREHSEKILDIVSQMTARTTNYFMENYSSKDFAKYYAKFEPHISDRFTLENRASQLRAMLNFDITRHFGNSLDIAVDSIQAEVFMIVSETDQLVHPGLSKKIAAMADNIDVMVLNNNCGHLAVGCEIDRCKEAIADFLEAKE